MVRFAALPEALVASVLEERHGLPREKAAVLAHVSGGSLGRALQLDGQEMLEWMMEALSGAAVVPWSTASDALSLAGELGRSRERADTAGRILGLLDLLGVYCRDAAAGAWRGGWERIVGAEALDRMDARSAAACFGTLEEARTALELHCSPQITLEALFMRMREAVRRG
jgi:DNA polymerase-3 subunit delta'